MNRAPHARPLAVRSDAVAVSRLFDRLLGARLLVFIAGGRAHLRLDGAVLSLLRPAVPWRPLVNVTFEWRAWHRRLLPK
jgi:hypothetical protein